MTFTFSSDSIGVLSGRFVLSASLGRRTLAGTETNETLRKGRTLFSINSNKLILIQMILQVSSSCKESYVRFPADARNNVDFFTDWEFYT